MFDIDLLMLLQTASQGETRVILALSCVVVASTLALAISIALARRMRKIAGPPPGEDPSIVSNTAQQKESASGDQVQHE